MNLPVLLSALPFAAAVVWMFWEYHKDNRERDRQQAQRTAEHERDALIRAAFEDWTRRRQQERGL